MSNGNITSLGECAKRCVAISNCTCFSVSAAGCKVTTTPASLLVAADTSAYTPWPWQLYACKGGGTNATCRQDAFGSFNDSKCMGTGTVACQIGPAEGECVGPQDSVGENFSMFANERRTIEVLQLGVSAYTQINTAAAMLALRQYILSPTGLNVTLGSRVNTAAASGLLEMKLDPNTSTVELSLTKHPLPGYVLGLRLAEGLNARWTACLYQKSGWVFDPLSLYGPLQGRYTELGMAADGTAFAPLYVGRAELTHVVAGHPVVASGVGARTLFIQVTHIRQDKWHVSVHNPGVVAVSATISKTMELPGLVLGTKVVVVHGGSTAVLL